MASGSAIDGVDATGASSVLRLENQSGSAGVSDAGWAAVLFVLLPLPALGEVVAEQIGWLAPSPRRLVALTIPLGVGLGFGFARYLESPGDLLFWSVAIGYALVGLVALVLRWRHDARAADATAGGDAPGPPLTS